MTMTKERVETEIVIQMATNHPDTAFTPDDIRDVRRILDEYQPGPPDKDITPRLNNASLSSPGVITDEERGDVIRELHEARAEAIIDGDEKREEMLERAIALLQSPPKVSVTRELAGAVENIGSIIDERAHAMRSHASVYSSDRESAQMMAEADQLAEDMARLRSLGIAVGEASEAVDSGEGKEGK